MEEKKLVGFFNELCIYPTYTDCVYLTKDKDLKYMLNQYNIFIKFYKKLLKKDIKIILNKIYEIVENTNLIFLNDYISDKNIRFVQYKYKLFLIIPEIIKILILDYQFPLKCFPEDIIKYIDKNLSYKSARN